MVLRRSVFVVFSSASMSPSSLHLLAELGQGLVAARQRLAQEELGDDEDHQREDDDHEQRAEHVDIAGPDVEMAACAGIAMGQVA